MKFTAASIFASIGLITAQFSPSTLGNYGTSGYGMIGNSCCGNYNSMYGTPLSGFGSLSNFGSVLPVNSLNTYRNDPLSMNSGIGYLSGLLNSPSNYGLSNSLYNGMSQLSNYPISDPILAGALASYNNFNGLNSPFSRLGDTSIYPSVTAKKASPINQEAFSMLNEGI